MANETFYRFELAFSGEEQDVGILQGLDDTPLPFPVIEALYRSFESLPEPPILETSDDSAVVFLFTEKGVKEFAEPLNELIYELSSCDWQVICMAFQLEPEFSLYQDAYQIAFSRSDLLELMWPASFQYHEVSCICTDGTGSLIQYTDFNKPSLAQMIKGATVKNLSAEPQTQLKSSGLNSPVK